MYPDPYGPGPVDDMDAASRREFFGAGGRRPPVTEPTIVPGHGNGFDKPYAPDTTTDHPLSSQDTYPGPPPIRTTLAAHGNDSRFTDNDRRDDDSAEPA